MNIVSKTDPKPSPTSILLEMTSSGTESVIYLRQTGFGFAHNLWQSMRQNSLCKILRLQAARCCSPWCCFNSPKNFKKTQSDHNLPPLTQMFKRWLYNSSLSVMSHTHTQLTQNLKHGTWSFCCWDVAQVASPWRKIAQAFLWRKRLKRDRSRSLS